MATDEDQVGKVRRKAVPIIEYSKRECFSDPYPPTLKRWYVLRYKPRREYSVLKNLERANISVYFPQAREYKVLGQRGELSTGPLFPGYLFAKFDLGSEYRTVKYARGVHGVVSFGMTPAAVDEELILAIQARLASGAVIGAHQYRSGEIVKIHCGPLRGIEAVFERQLTPCQRAVLLLRAISFQAKVEVDLRNIVNL